MKSFEAEEQGNRVQVVTTYELPRLAAVLTMTYLIGGNGEIRISEQLAVDKEKKDMPHLFRFGMQLVMPGRFDRIDYYGRGPVENYDDRNESQRLGRYRQLVKDQYYPLVETDRYRWAWFGYSFGCSFLSLCFELFAGRPG